MKNFKNIAAALAVTIILFAGCKNPAEDVQIVVNTDIFKSPMFIQFVNAKANAAGPQNFNLEIIGPNASLVRTTTGGKVYKVAAGMINLLLDRTANPTPTNPVRFTIVANAPGYASTFQDVVVTSATDPLIYRVQMAEYANPAEATGAIVSTKAIANGTSNSELTFATATNATMNLKSDITIPTGTGFLDAAGQAIAGNQLEARIIHFGTNADGLIPALPGGNIASNILGANGQPITGGAYLSSIGAVSIDMFAGSKEVKSFTKPLDLEIEVNANAINTATNQPYKSGETIPLWSLNEETGQWKSEGNATFATNAAGKLVAKASITHLSVYSTARMTNPCTTTIVINRPSAEFEETVSIIGMGLRGDMVLKKGDKVSTFVITTSNNYAGIRWSLLTDGNKSLRGPETPDPCGKTTTFNLERPVLPDVINVNVDIKFKCSDKDLLTGINAFSTVTPANGTSADSKVYRLVNGQASGQGTVGVTYKIVTSVDGIIYNSQFTVERKSSTLTTGDLTGTVTYNATTNSISVQGLATKNCN